MQEGLKNYTLREEWCSAAIHLAGAAAVLAGAFPLITLAMRHDNPGLHWGLGFFWFSLLLMFSVSGSYHLLRRPQSKILFRKFDHAAIYWLIAGTYAPILLGALRTPAAYVLFAILLLLSIGGGLGKMFFAQRFHKLEVAVYLLMGWCCIFVAIPMFRAMSALSLWLLLAGGIAYSGGVVFYAMKREFSHALWHLFVLAGAILHYCAVRTMFD